MKVKISHKSAQFDFSLAESGLIVDTDCNQCNDLFEVTVSKLTTCINYNVRATYQTSLIGSNYLPLPGRLSCSIRPALRCSLRSRSSNMAPQKLIKPSEQLATTTPAQPLALFQ